MGNRSKKPKTIRPVNKQNQEAASILAASRSLKYSGPIPMASEMAKYEALCPGATDRILKIAEKSLKMAGQQAEHRQKIELDTVESTNHIHLIGVVFAGVIVLASLCFAAFCVYMSHEIIGALFGSGGIGSIVYAFIYGTRSNRQEREAKWEKALQARKDFQA